MYFNVTQLGKKGNLYDFVSFSIYYLSLCSFSWQNFPKGFLALLFPTPSILCSLSTTPGEAFIFTTLPRWPLLKSQWPASCQSQGHICSLFPLNCHVHSPEHKFLVLHFMLFCGLLWGYHNNNASSVFIFKSWNIKFLECDNSFVRECSFF